MKTTLLSIILLTLSTLVNAQSEIQGKVIDAKTKETIPFATVSTIINGKLVSAQTDLDGYYSIKPLPEGTYDITVYYPCYGDHIINCVETKADRITFLDPQLTFKAIILEEVEIVIICGLSNTHATPTKEEIADNISIQSFRGCGVIPAKYVRRYNRKARKEANKLADCRHNQEIEYHINGSPCPYFQPINDTNNDQPTNEATQLSKEQAKTDDITQAIICFPNPTFDQLNIALKDNITELYIADVNGKIVQQCNIQGNKNIQIDMNQYNKGIYFVQYRTGNQWKSQQIVSLCP